MAAPDPAFATDGEPRAVTQIRDGLAAYEFEPFFQPIVRLSDASLVGFEALARWRHAERGLIEPADFIALAEETSLIVPVGEYVLSEVCNVLRRLAGFGLSSLPFIALNVSGRQLEDADFVERVLAQTRASGADATNLKLEITESLVLDYAKVSALIERCHHAGIRVALDDFGTGYSNLGHLHKLSFDTLKLDQGFIRQLDDPRCLAIVRAVIGMAGALDCDIVAEGVETKEQLERLRGLGCQYAQGWLIGKPLDIESAIALANA